jgi:hypothetical protein
MHGTLVRRGMFNVISGSRFADLVDKRNQRLLVP